MISEEAELRSLREGIADLKKTNPGFSEESLETIRGLLDQTSQNINNIKGLVDKIRQQIGDD